MITVFQGSTSVRKLPPPEELVFDLDDTVQQRISANRQNFAKMVGRVSYFVYLTHCIKEILISVQKVHIAYSM